MSIEAMKLALEALNVATTPLAKDRQEVLRAQTALRTAIEQAEKQEPVATVTSETGNPDVMMSWWHEPALPVGTLLYTAPPKREWVGLTDEEISDLWDGHTVPVFCKTGINPIVFARAIEARLKEKNR